MGDISAEPSMEEILSSIKRIIAEEGDPPVRARRAAGASSPSPAPARPAPVRPAVQEPAEEPSVEEPEVLELNTPVSSAPRAAARPAAEPILSRETAEASRGALDNLSRLITRPESGSDGTLEGLVREMLRPMLREWLDAHLPGIVEQMVAREISKITGQA